MRICCGLLDNAVYGARLGRNEDASPGRAVVILENREILLPEDAVFGEFSILEATALEREELRAAGYALPDFDPARPRTRLEELGRPGGGRKAPS
jgi:hypothetical protein